MGKNRILTANGIRNIPLNQLHLSHLEIKRKMKGRVVDIVVIGRQMKLCTFRSPCDFKNIRKKFTGRKYVDIKQNEENLSILFENTDTCSKLLDKSDIFYLEMIKKVFPSAFQELINLVDSDKEFDPEKTSYSRFLYKSSKRRESRKRKIDKKIKLIRSVKENGIITPLLVGQVVDNMPGEKYILLNGDHRFLIAKYFGFKSATSIVCCSVGDMVDSNIKKVATNI